jgi:hypothetical protein
MPQTIEIASRADTINAVPGIYATVTLGASTEDTITFHTDNPGTPVIQLVSDVAWFWTNFGGGPTSAAVPVAANQAFEFTLNRENTALILKMGAGGGIRVVRVK